MVCETRRTVPWPRMMPATKPSDVPINPRIIVSLRIKTKIWRRVVPSERRMPMTGRRCTTLNVTVL